MRSSWKCSCNRAAIRASAISEIYFGGLPRLAYEIPCASAAFRNRPAFFMASDLAGPAGIARAASNASSASRSRSLPDVLAIMVKLGTRQHDAEAGLPRRYAAKTGKSGKRSKLDELSWSGRRSRGACERTSHRRNIYPAVVRLREEPTRVPSVSFERFTWRRSFPWTASSISSA
jgi:hypothetical protein